MPMAVPGNAGSPAGPDEQEAQAEHGLAELAPPGKRRHERAGDAAVVEEPAQLADMGVDPGAALRAQNRGDQQSRGIIGGAPCARMAPLELLFGHHGQEDWPRSCNTCLIELYRHEQSALLFTDGAEGALLCLGR